MADQHYKRVSNFAKEMLVWPEEIEVHKIKNEQFISEVKPPAAASGVPPLPLIPQREHSSDNVSAVTILTGNNNQRGQHGYSNSVDVGGMQVSTGRGRQGAASMRF